mmetsp:Transcript_7769/g.19276  ORF Transcript_7769/g.19276 Transcript_7769/m.19276 type:complete len:230 (+) Transcript_7769:969-1658(+)
MTRRRPPSGRPWMHWKMAECSESAGRMLTPYSRARGSTKGPPAMSVSLLARQMSFLALMAATVGSRPAHPTMPVTTASASLWRATSTAPSSPTRISGWGLTPLIISLSSDSLEASLMATILGLNFLICSASSLMLEPAARATSSNLSGNSEMMSSVWVPMDPVEPSSENFFGSLRCCTSGATQRAGQAGGGGGALRPLRLPALTVTLALRPGLRAPFCILSCMVLAIRI